MLSLIIPFKNAARFLPEAVLPFQSALENRSVELILVDNGSDDGSRQLLEGYIRDGLPLKLLTSAENGPGLARNYGLQHAKGSRIAFLDADDQVDPDGLLALCARMDTVSADLAVFNHCRLYPNGKTVNNRRSDLLEGGDVITDEAGRLKLLDNFNVAWNKIYSRTMITQHNLRFPAGIYEDIPWSISCLYAAQRIITEPATLYTYRQHPSSTLKARGEPHLALPEQYQRALTASERLGSGCSWDSALIERAVAHGLLIAYERKRLRLRLRMALLRKLIRFISANGGWHVVLASPRIDSLQRWALRLRLPVLLELRFAIERFRTKVKQIWHPSR